MGMSLTKEDTQQIRTIVREEVRPIVREEVEVVFQTEGRKIVREEIDQSITSLDGKLSALENDIKEIYSMISDMQKLSRPIAHFEKYDLDQKITLAYKTVVAIAKDAGTTLPRA